MISTFEWSEADNFLDREEQLSRLEAWWGDNDRQPLNLYGRRRVGKSWLFRRFAHGKPAVILVAQKGSTGKQLTAFASLLEPLLGVRPDLPDIPTLFRVVLRAAHDNKLLVVVDEFPYLLPRGKPAIDALLSAIAAVFEDELQQSQGKLILCGSTVSVMASLQEERNPMHGRLTPHLIRPLSFDKASLFMPTLGPLERFERFAIAGGMPRYLALLGEGEIKPTLCRQVLSRDAPLFDEVKTALAQELVQSGTHFSILELLADGAKETAQLATPLKQTTHELTSYLKTLSDVGLVERELPIGAPNSSRSGHWYVTDPFFAFWFRFVFPFQDGLESGLRPEDLFSAEVAPVLSHHVSPVFEEWCRSWTRTNFGGIVTTVGRWWGNALNSLRATGERSSEEIDIVGTARSRVTVVGEAKWTNEPMPASIITDLDSFKLPALTRDGFKFAKELKILLFSKSGYAPALQRLAESDERIILVDVVGELDQLDAEVAAVV